MLAGSTRLAIAAPMYHKDMTLASFHPLVPIEPANPAAFGGFHRLAIHDDNGWTLTRSCLQSCLLVECCLEAAPDAGILPRSEVVIYGARRWKRSGNQAHWHPVR